jgi:hypothetical protein
MSHNETLKYHLKILKFRHRSELRIFYVGVALLLYFSNFAKWKPLFATYHVT